MNILNYKLQPKDVEDFCTICQGCAQTSELENLFVYFNSQNQIHLTLNQRLLYPIRKLTVQEIFLIRTLCK